MMRKIIFAFILSLVLFASCKKDWLDSEIFLCGATINGASYNGKAQLPFGVIMIENLKEPGEEMPGSYSLSGTLIFDSYNPKNRQCEGHFKLSNEHAEGVAQTYLVEGKFKTEIYNHNTVNN